MKMFLILIVVDSMYSLKAIDLYIKISKFFGCKLHLNRAD